MYGLFYLLMAVTGWILMGNVHVKIVKSAGN